MDKSRVQMASETTHISSREPPSAPQEDLDTTQTCSRDISADEGNHGDDVIGNNTRAASATEASSQRATPLSQSDPNIQHLSTTNSESTRQDNSLLANNTVHVSCSLPIATVAPSNKKQVYRSSRVTATTSATEPGISQTDRFVTRDIATLEFLLGIPLANEGRLVRAGYARQQYALNAQKNDHPDQDDDSEGYLDGKIRSSAHIPSVSPAVRGIWWGKHLRTEHVPSGDNYVPLKGEGELQEVIDDDEELERPDAMPLSEHQRQKRRLSYSAKNQHHQQSSTAALPFTTTPGRRLQGDRSFDLCIPLTQFHAQQHGARTTQRAIARTAALREWERRTAHGLPVSETEAPAHPPLLEGRLFFAASHSYPVNVSSVIRYEPAKEQAELLRKKLERLGLGGSHYSMPTRDWRGISYRALLPRKQHRAKKQEEFNRFVRKMEESDVDDEDYEASDDDDAATSKWGSSRRNKKRKSRNKKKEVKIVNSSNSSKQGNSQDQDDADDDDETAHLSSSDSEDSHPYTPGVLDDPSMRLGRHRNVMIGDHIAGPLVASTIQFVEPTLLKAELNKQFRDRFDGWEPPVVARKYIGAYVSVSEGKYVLHDPTDDSSTPTPATTVNENATATTAGPSTTSPAVTPSVLRPGSILRKRQSSVTSMESTAQSSTDGAGITAPQLRIPPSLTLSKIRSIKQKALTASLKAKLELGTVALACVYFERLCLDCRVDKSNRRVSFAACLLLASKLNEPNDSLVALPTKTAAGDNDDKSNPAKLVKSLIRPNKRSQNMYASLLEFFTEEWTLAVKHLFDAEWGVFCALGFKLHVKPSQVSFHFKRILKSLQWNAQTYLGDEMYAQWQLALRDEERQNRERERRQERRRQFKEERLLTLQLKLEQEVYRREQEAGKVEEGEEDVGEDEDDIVGSPMTHRDDSQPPDFPTPKKDPPATPATPKSGLFNRLGMRRIRSIERLPHHSTETTASGDVFAMSPIPDHTASNNQEGESTSHRELPRGDDSLRTDGCTTESIPTSEVDSSPQVPSSVV